ncbi:hypothetical protein CONPUDRAFT_137537 [Coniophora puteana RWD-64-598 SS2]|uniref:Cx9C motif-containing protein 4, mitochondrial n=1 Tax=Coniophora puteana (strain RWD-64-598) TaxID=741705 RepID=A0A5M3MND4_CONPW|nr:uncharacterized protein CONPUDRAFT_137537 [Coniophora puteana RWD-64-598 SS2]EIW80235.1 hypothetical protein CONPUDRAFT_137537 [Coniophora puteana RWD-64-598 SS2]
MQKVVCQNEACALQGCLGKNTYSPEKCDEQMRRLYLCCQRMYDSNSNADSHPCPMPSVVDRWLKSHPPQGQKSSEISG